MIVEAVIAGLAGWRLASLLVREEGPFLVFERLRARAGVPAVGEIAPKPVIGGALSCMLCCSVWTTAAAAGFGAFVWWGPVWIVAGMAIAVIVEKALP